VQGQAQLHQIQNHHVHKVYRRWAPVYDATFGRIVEAGVKEAAKHINQFSGRLLDVGVGTGLALPQYGPQLRVTGIDLSRAMLDRARKRVEKSGKGNVEALLEMDATSLAFGDNSFDVAVAMYVVTVVPDPARVMHELARVLKPGGRLIIVNHFSVDKGLRGAIEKGMGPHASKIGWRAEFPVETIMVSDRLRLADKRDVKPFGLFTLLEFVKQT
jgi:phosphatidylethanolamine/phosphatidyl-N-methylethanolamine N-methyltransferase